MVDARETQVRIDISAFIPFSYEGFLGHSRDIV